MKKLIVSALILMFILIACKPAGNAADAAIAALEATRSAQNAAATAKAQAPSAEPPTAAPTVVPATLAPTETATAVPTPTEVPTVKATTNLNANCRYGPDKVFSLVELLNSGTTALVIGQYTANGQWWKVRTDKGSECWVLGSNVSITGDVNIVALLESPATPTPVPPPSWAGDWTLKISTDFADPDNRTVVMPIVIKQSGNSVSSYFSFLSTNLSFAGTVSSDGMSVLGTLQYGSPWNFKIRLYRVPGNLNQFQGEFYDGKYNGTAAGSDGVFCGGSKGAQPPIPCRP
jgi:hypothetical protein